MAVSTPAVNSVPVTENIATTRSKQHQQRGNNSSWNNTNNKPNQFHSQKQEYKPSKGYKIAAKFAVFLVLVLDGAHRCHICLSSNTPTSAHLLSAPGNREATLQYRLNVHQQRGSWIQGKHIT